MRLAFQVAYLGDRFFGSQFQVGYRTVEGEFIAACERMALFPNWKDARFLFAGRTDRGVHAYGQVCAFTTNAPDRAIQVMNFQLPRDCWCRGYAEVPDTFHPRYNALSRTYRYFISDISLDTRAMIHAADIFVGPHDFSSFARVEDQNPIRTLQAVNIWREDSFIVVEVKGESFLWHMVRGIVTALEMVGRSEIAIDQIAKLLNGKDAQRIPAAPAANLVLWDVDCGISFVPLSIGERHARSLNELQRYHVLMEKITGTLQFGN